MFGRRSADHPCERGADGNSSRIPGPEEQARARAVLDRFDAELRTAEATRAANPDPEPFDPVRAEQWRQRADVMGTEGYPDHLYDGAGNIVYTRRGFDGWYDNDGVRRFDLVMRRVDSPGAQ